MEKAELKTGKHFSLEEKEVILSSIERAKRLYHWRNSIFANLVICRSTCPLLREGIQAYLVRKYFDKNRIDHIRALGDQLFTKLKIHYHNPEFYISKGLETERDCLFWWPLHDTASRREALNILEQAIIND